MMPQDINFQIRENGQLQSTVIFFGIRACPPRPRPRPRSNQALGIERKSSHPCYSRRGWSKVIDFDILARIDCGTLPSAQGGRIGRGKLTAITTSVYVAAEKLPFGGRAVEALVQPAVTRLADRPGRRWLEAERRGIVFGVPLMRRAVGIAA